MEAFSVQESDKQQQEIKQQQKEDQIQSVFFNPSNNILHNVATQEQNNLDQYNILENVATQVQNNVDQLKEQINQKIKDDQKETSIVNNENNEDDFENFNEKLNITADEINENDIDDLCDPALLKEVDKFMNEVYQKEQKPCDANGADQMAQFQNLLGGMFSSDQKGVGSADEEHEVANMMKQFGEMFQNENIHNEGQKSGASNSNNSNMFDNMANELLYQFMDKEILLEPLLEAKSSYEAYFKSPRVLNDSHLLQSQNFKDYQLQYSCIKELLGVLQTDPNNKNKLLELFERLQSYGQVPDEMTKELGQDNPLQKMFASASQGGGNEQQCLIF